MNVPPRPQAGAGLPAPTGQGDQPIRVGVLVANHAEIDCIGLDALLSADTRFELVAITSEIAAVPSEFLDCVCDVVVVLNSARDPSRRALSALRDVGVEAPVLMLTHQCTGAVVIEALQAGAAGVMHAAVSARELTDAIIRVAQGQSVLSAEASAAIVPEILATMRAKSEHALSPREIEILHELARGGTTMEIGLRMHLAVPTVKNHVAHIYAKLGVRDRGAAVAAAIRLGVVNANAL